MKFSIFATSIICGTVVHAAPASNPQAEVMEVIEVVEVVQPAAVVYTTVETFTFVVGASAASLTDSPGSSNSDSSNPGNDFGDRGTQSEETAAEIYFESGRTSQNPINLYGQTPSNPNQVAGSDGNTGAQRDAGSDPFGISVYNYEGNDFDQQSSSITTFFRLVANATGDDFLNINGFYVNTYHVSAGSSLAQLTSPSAGNNSSNARVGNGSGRAGNGRVFYTDGTDEEVNNQLGTVVTSGGTHPLQESIVLTDRLASTKVAYSRLGNIYINAGDGTKGVQVVQNSEGSYILTGAGDSSYFACYNENVPYDSAVTLLHLQDHEDVPEDCESIVLIPECSEDDGNPFTIGEANVSQQNQVGCYFAVSAGLLAL